jgi:hypothetical protein
MTTAAITAMIVQRRLRLSDVVVLDLFPLIVRNGERF